MTNLINITEEALAEYTDILNDWYNKDYLIDRIHEIADRHVPIYYSEIIEVASNDLQIALDIPAMIAGNTETSAIKLMSANIYEHINNKLRDHHYEHFESKRGDETL